MNPNPNPNQIYNIEKLIAFRRDIHKNAETAFQEFKTGEKILNYLKEIGINTSQAKILAKTGIVLDISGTGTKVIKTYQRYYIYLA